MKEYISQDQNEAIQPLDSVVQLDPEVPEIDSDGARSAEVRFFDNVTTTTNLYPIKVDGSAEANVKMQPAGGRMDRLMDKISNVSSSKSTKLLTGLAMLGMVAQFVPHRSEAQAVPDSDAIEQTADIAEDEIVETPSVTYQTTEDGIEIRMNGYEQVVRVLNYDNYHEWDIELPFTYDGFNTSRNELFNNHREIVLNQYSGSLSFGPEEINADTNITNFYEHEVGSMNAGEYPVYVDIYGNMQMGDYEEVRDDMFKAWEGKAEALGWGEFDSPEDYESLSAYQWMVILQEPGAQLEYNPDFASIYDSYDEDATEKHMGMTIEELMESGEGVCRDIERLNIASYMVANAEFNLADRGLLYVPVINYNDAKHTRGLFMLSSGEHVVNVVGVDTTNAGDDTRVYGSSSEPENVSGWYAQNFGKDWLTDEDAQVFYGAFLEEYGYDLSPTVRAMVQREILLADIGEAEDFANNAEHRTLYTEVFEKLNDQIEVEAVQQSETLRLSSRVVHQYDLLVALSREADRYTADHLKVNQIRAQKAFEQYLQSNGVDPELARKRVHLLDIPGKDEKITLIRNVHDQLSARAKQVPTK